MLPLMTVALVNNVCKFVAILFFSTSASDCRISTIWLCRQLMVFVKFSSFGILFVRTAINLQAVLRSRQLWLPIATIRSLFNNRSTSGVSTPCRSGTKSPSQRITSSSCKNTLSFKVALYFSMSARCSSTLRFLTINIQIFERRQVLL